MKATMPRRSANTPLRRPYLLPGSDPPPTFVTGAAMEVTLEHPRDGGGGKAEKEKRKNRRGKRRKRRASSRG